jgi:hypothetical protein
MPCEGFSGEGYHDAKKSICDDDLIDYKNKEYCLTKVYLYAP